MIGALIKHRWLIVGAGAALLVLGAYVYGELKYYEGKRVCAAEIKAATQEAEIKSLRGANDVRKKEQSLDKRRLIHELDRLGILRDS